MSNSPHPTRRGLLRGLLALPALALRPAPKESEPEPLEPLLSSDTMIEAMDKISRNQYRLLKMRGDVGLKLRDQSRSFATIIEADYFRKGGK